MEFIGSVTDNIGVRDVTLIQSVIWNCTNCQELHVLQTDWQMTGVIPMCQPAYPGDT